MEHISRSFRVSFSVRHDLLPPEAITCKLGMEPTRSTAVGSGRVNSTGRPLSGTYPATLWVVDFETSSTRELVSALGEILDHLAGRRDAIRAIVEGKGTAELFCGVWADGNWDEEIPWELMARLSDLRINLRIDVYPNKTSVSVEVA